MSGQPDLGGEGAGGTCGSCGRALPAPDLEAVAASIDQTLSMESGKIVARTAWAGPAPDGAVDALLSWLPSVKAKKQLWERGQQLWAEQMTMALSGPCEHCRSAGEPVVPGATLVPSTAEPSPPYESSTMAMPVAPQTGGSAPQVGGSASPTPAFEEPAFEGDEGRTAAMPAFLDSGPDTADRPTAAASSFGSSFGTSDQPAPPPAAPEPEADEHESHTMILSALPSLRTTTRLVVVDGPVHGRQFSLGRQLTTIGRSIGCHVTVEADDVAYDHARIVRTDHGWQIELIGSATGLLVNDDPVRDVRPLRNGDIIKVGPARLRFESTGQPG
jgi:hypothetical protein